MIKALRVKNMNLKNSRIIWVVLCLILIGAYSCNTRHKKTSVGLFSSGARFSESDFAEKLGTVYHGKEGDTTNKKKKFNVHELVRRTYGGFDFLPLWLNENGNTDAADKFLEDLETLNDDGLDPERYKLSRLKKELKEFEKNKLTDINALVSLDTSLTHSYIQASHDLLLGAVAPEDVDSLWFHANDSNWHPDRLLLSTLGANNSYPSLDSFRSNVLTYKLLKKARKHYAALKENKDVMGAKQALATGANNKDSLITVIIKNEMPVNVGVDGDTTKQGGLQMLNAYQDFYAIKRTGKIDSNTLKYLSRMPDSILSTIDVNLERVRWLPKNLEPMYVLVDIPLFELYFRRNEMDVMHMNVVVGKTERQTPVLNAKMANIVFNPPWGVPPTIMKKDVLPGMQKSGQAYLDKKDLKVYDKKGHEVDASRVNASNYKQFNFRQPPGDDNALGYIKFNLPNKFDIYLHDTPHRELFDKPDRAQSSGCVRVQKPREMALFILSDVEGRHFTNETVDSIIRTQKTKWEILKNKIPVHIVYLTAIEDDTHEHIRFAKDVYKRDRRLAAALRQGI
jgi:murein L,D-transpeptidase YcbB/YkuD